MGCEQGGSSEEGAACPVQGAPARPLAAPVLPVGALSAFFQGLDALVAGREGGPSRKHYLVVFGNRILVPSEGTLGHVGGPPLIGCEVTPIIGGPRAHAQPPHPARAVPQSHHRTRRAGSVFWSLLLKRVEHLPESEGIL